MQTEFSREVFFSRLVWLVSYHDWVDCASLLCDCIKWQFTYYLIIWKVPFSEWAFMFSIIMTMKKTKIHLYFLVMLRPQKQVFPLHLLLRQFFITLLDRNRSQGSSWAALSHRPKPSGRLSYCPKPSGRAVHEKFDGLDIGGQHGWRFVLLRHTHRPQRRPYPICTSRRGNVRHRCGGG